jgi:hypothetical protein
VLGLALLANAAHAQAPTPKPPPVTSSVPAPDPRAKEDERARAAFNGLTPAQKKELLDFLELETSHLGSFQAGLIAWVQKSQDRDPAQWPVLGPPPAFDPTVHAPAQPIARHVLDPASPAAKSAMQRILGPAAPSAHAMRSAYVYDYASGELRRVVTNDEPGRVFENALAGYPPRLDLAEALVERMLDDGSQKKRAEAFGHAYSDRSGNVVPMVTLYDAYGSGMEIEMPDVETLGILHTLFDDWTTWKAPIPGPKQEPLYEKIGAEFTPLHRHRGLRHALSLTFASGSGELRDGYEGYLDNLHALWEDCSSTPEKLAARLPAPENWSTFLDAWRKRCLEPGPLYAAGQNRRAVLDSDARNVRATVFRVLEEYGAFATAKPAAAGKTDGDKDH